MPTEWPDLETSVPDWLIEYPSLLRSLEQLGIDYSCGGKSLEAACREAGRDPHQVLEQLRAVIAASRR